MAGSTINLKCDIHSEEPKINLNNYLNVPNVVNLMYFFGQNQFSEVESNNQILFDFFTLSEKNHHALNLLKIAI